MTPIKKRLLTQGHRCRPGGEYKKTSITIHSTGNPTSTGENERNWLDNPSNHREASWHYVVDETSVIQAIPDIEEAWHCGNSKGNRYSVGVEICERGDRKKTLENAAGFVAGKLKELDLTVADLKQHHDWTGKNCPRILIDSACIKEGMDWNWFVGKVQDDYKGKEEPEVEIRYQNIGEVPKWGKETIQKLIDKGAIADPEKLDLSMDMLRVLVIIGR